MKKFLAMLLIAAMALTMMSFASAEDVTITTGDDCRWIGGITGYAGGYADEQYGMPVTVFKGCIAKNVTVNAGEKADGIGDIVGTLIGAVFIAGLQNGLTILNVDTYWQQVCMGLVVLLAVGLDRLRKTLA